jgi:heme/copper-type cytochrome/quinol oxidase subunit 4
MSILRRVLEELDLFCHMTEHDGEWFVRGLAFGTTLFIAVLVVGPLLDVWVRGGGR